MEVKRAQGEMLDHRGLSVSPEREINWLGSGHPRSLWKFGKLIICFEQSPWFSQAHGNVIWRKTKVIFLSLTHTRPMHSHTFSLHNHVSLAAMWPMCSRVPNIGFRCEPWYGNTVVDCSWEHKLSQLDDEKCWTGLNFNMAQTLWTLAFVLPLIKRRLDSTEGDRAESRA